MTQTLTQTSWRVCLRCGRLKAHCRRGLCRACVDQGRQDGTLADYPTQIRPREDVVADYLTLVLRDPQLPNRDIAARLGMKPNTLTKALERARAAGLLNVRRVSYGHRPDIARRGELDGRPA